MSELFNAAIRYAMDGWPVFPCEEAGKRPLTPQGLKDASTDLDTIREWWRKWPRANVAIPTGLATGVVVVDLDGEQGKHSFAGLIAEHGEPPETLQSVTGNGRHLLFRCPNPPVRNTQSKLARGIDTRGEGGYIIVAPSIHPSGAVYEWSGEGVDPADLPSWLNTDKIKHKRKPANLPALPLESDVCRRASLYLAQMPGAIQGCGGHSSLYAAATAMVHGFDLPVETAYQLLATEFNPRCSPQWDLSDPKDERDFRRKLNQAKTQPHDQPLGWLLLDAPPSGDIDHGKRQADAILGSANRNKPLPAAAPAPTVGALPAHLLQPPGLVGEMVAWINETAIMPQPELALGAALSFVGAIVGRKVRTPNDLRSNLYCLGVADSGSGKDHARKAIKKISAEAGIISDVLGGEEVSSDAAILSAVDRQPSLLFLLDEIGHLLSSSNGRNAMAYQKNIPTLFTKLFSSASTMMLGREYAGKEERKDYDQPNVCLYGSTVPGTLYRGLTPDDISNGFLSRMLVFAASNPDPDPRDDLEAPPPPPELVEKLKGWHAYTPETPEGVGDIVGMLRVWPAVAEVDDEAARIFKAFREQARKHKAKVRGDRGLDSLWARAAEHAWKIALVVSCGEAGQPVVIGADVAAYAVDLVERLVRGLVLAVQDNVSETVAEGDKQKIIRVIRDLGDSATPTRIGRKTQSMTMRARNEALADLRAAGVLATKASENKSGPKTEVFYLVDQDAA